MRLKDKVAIVTGAGSGIGRETATLFAKEGAKIIVAEVNEKSGHETIFNIKHSGGEATHVKVDVTNRQDTKEMADVAIKKYGRVDILINNAGIIQDALITKMTEEQWDKVINTDLKGAFNCIQAVVDIMIRQGSGVIINASSVSGVYGNIGQTNYSAAKAGLVGVTKTLAKELGRKGIRVNAVSPGFIMTPMTASVPEKVLNMMKDRNPMHKLGETKDVAYAYLYLASDEAKYVNGEVFEISGGLTI